MGRAKHRDTEIFAQIPVKVLISDAFRTLRPRYQMVLIAMAAQYRGNNNGDIAFTRKIAQHYGITSETTRCRGLKLLAERGLIVKTHSGGKKPMKPTLWALGWRQIEYSSGEKRQVVKPPPNEWQEWENKSTAPHVEVATAPPCGAVNPDNGTTRRSGSNPSTAPPCGVPSRSLAWSA